MEAVVVTYNSAAALSGLVASDATLNAFSRILVVDNGSTDSTCAIADAAGLDVERLAENRGFGAAANVGIAATGGELVALLNPDIEVRDRADLERLAQHFADAQVALVAPALRLPDGEVQDSARDGPTPANLIRRRIGDPRAGVIERPTPSDVAWVVGAVMVFRRSAFETVSGFDERYHLYFEDVDLCVRLRRRGYRVRLDPTVTVNHQHAAQSRGSLLAWSTRQHMRSALLFYLRNPQFVFSADG